MFGVTFFVRVCLGQVNKAFEAPRNGQVVFFSITDLWEPTFFFESLVRRGLVAKKRVERLGQKFGPEFRDLK